MDFQYRLFLCPQTTGLQREPAHLTRLVHGDNGTAAAFEWPDLLINPLHHVIEAYQEHLEQSLSFGVNSLYPIKPF